MSNINANKLSFKNEIFASEFHERLFSVLSEGLEKRVVVSTWATRLNCSPGTIRDGWFSIGSYPVSDMTAKICELSGVSADWLLLGKGPKYKDQHQPEQVMEETQPKGQEPDNTMAEMERRIDYKLQHVLSLIDRQWKQLDRIEEKLESRPPAPEKKSAPTIPENFIGQPILSSNSGIWSVEMLKKIVAVDKLGDAAKAHLEKSIDFVLKGAAIAKKAGNDR